MSGHDVVYGVVESLVDGGMDEEDARQAVIAMDPQEVADFAIQSMAETFREEEFREEEFARDGEERAEAGVLGEDDPDLDA